MAIPLERREVLLAIAESTYGTDPGITDSDAMYVESASFTNNDTMHGRSVRAGLIQPQRTSTIGRRSWSISVSQYLRGGVTAYDATHFAQVHPFLVAAGFSSSHLAGTHTYRPAYDSAGSATMSFYQDGTRITSSGIRGDASFTFTPGAPVMMNFTGQGLWSDVTDSPLMVPDYSNEPLNPPIVTGATFRPYTDNPTAAQSGHVHNVTINLRMGVQSVESMSLAATSNGVAKFVNTGAGSLDDPGIEVVFDVEQPVMGALNPDSEWWDRFLNREIGASSSITVGSAAKNTFVFTIARMFVQSISQIKLKGMQGHRITCRAMGSDGAGAEDSLLIAAS